MTYHGIDVPRTKIAEFCRRHHIRELALFGSILREAFGPDSDVDVLVTFQPGHPIGLIGMAVLERELSEMLGRKVDLRTPAELSRYFRDEVVRTREVQFLGDGLEGPPTADCGIGENPRGVNGRLT